VAHYPCILEAIGRRRSIYPSCGIRRKPALGWAGCDVGRVTLPVVVIVAQQGAASQKTCENKIREFVQHITSPCSLLPRTKKIIASKLSEVLYSQWSGLLEVCQICSRSGTTTMMFLGQPRKEYLVRSLPLLDWNRLIVLRY
jgi:hypothetical protein